MRKKRTKPKSQVQSTDEDIQLMIRQEVEEFLRDLTLEYPFPEIFEILRRHEFKDRFGRNVTPLPQKRFCAEALKEIEDRIGDFLTNLKKTFGPKFESTISDSFRFYTETTLDE
jgi:hypothetical protein